MEHPDCQELSDNEIIVQTLRNQDYFACIIHRYQGKLLSYIRRISNVNLQEAEDILQESFIKAYLNLNDFDTSLKFSSWIYRIVHNQTISNFRRQKARPEGNLLDVEDKILNNFAHDLDLHKEMDHKLLKKMIESALRQLPRKYREVIVLRFFLENSYDEIADILQKPNGTVATLINRAKKQLQNILKKHVDAPI